MASYKSNVNVVGAVRRGKRFGRVVRPVALVWFLLLGSLLLVSLAAFLKLHSLGDLEKVGVGEQAWSSESREAQVSGNGGGRNSTADGVEQRSAFSNVGEETKSKRRKQHFPCDVGLAESVEFLTEPEGVRNFTKFSLEFVASEEELLRTSSLKPRFGGHQTLQERQKSFHATSQTIHCGFVQGPGGLPCTGFDLDAKDREFMNTCRVVVSSCIFGNSDFLRRPTSKKISEFSKRNVCFVMFVDEQTLPKLSSEGHIPDEKGYVGLWRMVVVRNLPYGDMRRTGKVPKLLSHRLFPSSRYSIWLDSKMRLITDPMLILEHFLWRTGSEYAISNHYDRHCVWEEVLQNKRLNKYNHTAIDEQFNFYQADGLVKFDPSDPTLPLPSCSWPSKLPFS